MKKKKTRLKKWALITLLLIIDLISIYLLKSGLYEGIYEFGIVFINIMLKVAIIDINY